MRAYIRRGVRPAGTAMLSSGRARTRSRKTSAAISASSSASRAIKTCMRRCDSLDHHGPTLDLRAGRGDRDDGVLRARAPQPLVRARLRGRVRARLDLWLRAGGVAVRAGRGGVGAGGAAAVAGHAATRHLTNQELLIY